MAAKRWGAAANRSAPAALPAQSEGCGGAENEKAPINVEALNRCACLPSRLCRHPAFALDLDVRGKFWLSWAWLLYRRTVLIEKSHCRVRPFAQMLDHLLNHWMLAWVPLVTRNSNSDSEHRRRSGSVQRLLLPQSSANAENWIDQVRIPCLQLRNPNRYIFICRKPDLDESEILYLNQVDQNFPLHIASIKKPRTWRGMLFP